MEMIFMLYYGFMKTITLKLNIRHWATKVSGFMSSTIAVWQSQRQASVFLHGGPGSGIVPTNGAFFDRDLPNCLLNAGAGRTPHTRPRDNTTWIWLRISSGCVSI